MEKIINIAIDGPSGAGKSSIAKEVSRRYNILYLDTGALYRTVGLYILRLGIDSKDTSEILKHLDEISVGFRHIDGQQRVFLNKEDVSDFIRTPEASKYASDVSAIPEVRQMLLDVQRDMAKKNSVVMDGRDIGTVILPNADVKIFLTASCEARAERRFKELIEKEIDTTFDAVLEDMKKRDSNDSSRDIAPLKAADDAVTVDTSNLTLSESIEAVCSVIRGRI